MTERPPYTEIRHVLRQKLRWEQARIGQANELPEPDAISRWALRLEVLKRLERAHAQGDLTELRRYSEMAWRILADSRCCP
jgi:hypothetical protein